MKLSLEMQRSTRQIKTELPSKQMAKYRGGLKNTGSVLRSGLCDEREITGRLMRFGCLVFVSGLLV